jgi:branched-chain amino acid transport system permease protein
MKNAPRIFFNNAVGWLILTAIIALMGWIETTTPYGFDFADLSGGVITMDTMVRIAILTIVLVGLNLLMGYAGQVSMGHAAFYGIGAYISAVFTARAGSLFGLPEAILKSWEWPWIVMLAGMIFSASFAYLIGKPILRLRGHYLAMATLGLGIMAYILFREYMGFQGDHITGSYDGVSGIPRLRIGSFEIWPISRYYFFAWLMALGVMAFGMNLINSRMGRALRAVHGSEVAAQAMGIDVAAFKARVFAISAALASLGGSMYAHFQAAVSPAPFSFTGSLELVVMSSVGGLSSIWGAPFGVTMILFLKEFLRSRLRVLLSGASGEHEIIVYGLLLIVIMIFLPEGITSGVMKRWKLWKNQKGKMAAANEMSGGNV